MPDAESIYEQWEQFFGVQDLNLKLQKDYSHITVLQEDKKLEAEARKIRNEALKIEFESDLITMNRWLELNNEDPRPDGDRYYSDIAKERAADTQLQQQNSTDNQNNTAEENQTP